jgi:hypothetical protein
MLSPDIYICCCEQNTIKIRNTFTGRIKRGDKRGSEPSWVR